MKIIQLKSVCCKAAVRRFGLRRRQCSACKKTWRLRRRKRGRKRVRVHPDISKTVIERRESLRHKAERTNKGRELLRRRHERNLEGLVKYLSLPKAPKGDLIAVVDGMVAHAERKWCVIYLILLRSVKKKEAVLMEPLIKEGHEDESGWREALASLREKDRERIKVLVSDGFKSLKAIARENGWFHQRCHFHILKMLYSLLGTFRGNVSHKAMRRKMYQLVKYILAERNERRTRSLVKRLRLLSQSENCPKWFGRRVRGFLKQVDDFRTYLKYPKMHIPTTTNSAESTVNLLSETLYHTRGFKTRKSLELWIKIRARTLKKIQCNGKNYQPN